MAHAQTTRDLGLVKTNPGRIFASGAVRGIIGGVVMAMFGMMYAALKGMGFVTPLKMIAATLYDKEALGGGAGVLLVGLMIHMMGSIGWGIIFASLVPRTLSAAKAIPMGVIFGIGIWAIMTFGVLPLVNPVMRESVSMMPGAWFMQHLLFGMGLGLAPLLSGRRLSA